MYVKLSATWATAHLGLTANPDLSVDYSWPRRNTHSQSPRTETRVSCNKYTYRAEGRIRMLMSWEDAYIIIIMYVL